MVFAVCFLCSCLPSPRDPSRGCTQVNRIKRKVEQQENRELYDRSLVDLKGVVKEEEGASIRENLIAERRAWFTEELGKARAQCAGNVWCDEN